MTRLRTRAIPAVVLILVAAVALLVFRRQPDASWLRVEAPSAIVVGEPFIATVRLLEPADGAFLDFDLHGTTAGKTALNVVASGKTQAVADGQRTFTFTLVLRERPDVSAVHAIVYLSRSGHWGSAFRVARSDSLHAIRGTPRAADIVPKSLRVYDQQEAPDIEVANSPLLRAAIAALWLGAACVAATTRRSWACSATWLLFIILCIMFAAWEGLAPEPWIADHARLLARAASLYEERRWAQQLMTVALAAAAGLIAVVSLQRSRRLSGLALGGMALYAGVSLAEIVSLHEVDRVLAAKIAAWPIGGVLRLAGACAAMVGAARLAWKGSAAICGESQA